MQNIPTPTTSIARRSGEAVHLTEWTSGAYTLRKSKSDDYTVWTVRTNGRSLPRVEDMAGLDQTPNFGVSFSSQSDLAPIEATAYAGQIMGAAQAALAFNMIVASN